MTDLIITQTQIGTENINSVDARELHTTLGVKKAFTTWIKSNLDSIGAVKDEDYVILKSSLEGSGYKKIYVVSSDIAKHLAMMSKTENAKEVRDYFIAREKEANTNVLMSPNQITEALALTAKSLTLQDERMDAQHVQITEHTDRLIQLENNVRLTNQQEYELTQTHHKKVYELAKLYGEDQNDKKLISKLHRKVWSIFKKHFMLPRFNELAANKFDDGITFLNSIALKDI